MKPLSRLLRSAIATVSALIFLLPQVRCDDPSLFLQDYRLQLQEWSKQLDKIRDQPAYAEIFRLSLPKEMKVQDNGHQFEVHTEWLSGSLASFSKLQPQQRSDLLDNIQKRLDLMRQQAAIFSQNSGLFPQARNKLDLILARREFRRVHGPAPWEELLNRVLAWIIRMLDKLSGVSAPDQAGQLLVWIMIAAALSLSAVWLKRSLGRSIAEIRREIIPFEAPSAKSWKKWLAEADSCAQAGRWREAIHLAYWAAISRLEEAGFWVPDKARTPREYLRLLSAQQSVNQPFLAELTQQFELIWYGHRLADAQDFQQALSSFEKLQCLQ